MRVARRSACLRACRRPAVLVCHSNATATLLSHLHVRALGGEHAFIHYACCLRERMQPQGKESACSNVSSTSHGSSRLDCKAGRACGVRS